MSPNHEKKPNGYGWMVLFVVADDGGGDDDDALSG